MPRAKPRPKSRQYRFRFDTRGPWPDLSGTWSAWDAETDARRTAQALIDLLERLNTPWFSTRNDLWAALNPNLPTRNE